MAIALFAVKATITPDREEAFNEWYNHEHIPDLFKCTVVNRPIPRYPDDGPVP